MFYDLWDKKARVDTDPKVIIIDQNSNNGKFDPYEK